MCTCPIQVAPRLDMASQKKAAQAFDFCTPFDRKIRNYYYYYSTRYGLDGPEIESRWEARFSTLAQSGPGAHPASYRVFPGGKVAEV